ncbi:MAG: ABC transporter permease subunit [Chlorobi bacterium]|nr:ABC transporter permease subunit [Chlorobiota bacterium]
MTLFIRVLRSELIKAKRTKGFLISFLIPLIISTILFIVYYVKYEYFVSMGVNPWVLMGTNVFRIMGLIVLPMYLLLTAYIVNFTEHRSKSRKDLFTLPVPKFHIYMSKVLLIVIWYFIFILTSCFLFFLSAALLSFLRPELSFEDYDSNYLIIKTFSQLFVSGFGILSIQFFFSIYWDDFIRPVGLGFVFIIVTILLNSWKYIYLFPYSHPFYVSRSFTTYMDEKIIYYLLYGVLVSIVFFIGGYFMILQDETK